VKADAAGREGHRRLEHVSSFEGTILENALYWKMEKDLKVRALENNKDNKNNSFWLWSRVGLN
jgi:hypothetical protein